MIVYRDTIGSNSSSRLRLRRRDSRLAQLRGARAQFETAFFGGRKQHCWRIPESHIGKRDSRGWEVDMGVGDSHIWDGLAAKKLQLLQTSSPFRAGDKIGRKSSPPAVATQRTTVREARRALTLSTTAPETPTAVDGLQSAAPLRAAKGSDDMAAIGRFLGVRVDSSPNAAAGGRRRRRGQNGKCRGASGRKGYRLGMEGWDLSYPSRPLRRFPRHYDVATWHAILLMSEFVFCFRHILRFFDGIYGLERLDLRVDLEFGIKSLRAVVWWLWFRL